VLPGKLINGDQLASVWKWIIQLGFELGPRIQTWFPFTVHVCINGREWLARQLDQAQLHYRKHDNTFTWLEDIAQTQALFDQQLRANWPELLGGLARA
jgi:hypothetical protein